MKAYFASTIAVWVTILMPLIAVCNEHSAIMRWLDGKELMEPVEGLVIHLKQTRYRDNAGVVVAPNQKQILVIHETKEIEIIRPFASRENSGLEIELEGWLTNRRTPLPWPFELEGKLAIRPSLSCEWSADSDILYIQGYAPNGSYIWVRYDVNTMKITNSRDDLDKFLAKATQDYKVEKEHVPVWSMGGKEFEAEYLLWRTDLNQFVHRGVHVAPLLILSTDKDHHYWLVPSEKNNWHVIWENQIIGSYKLVGDGFYGGKDFSNYGTTFFREVDGNLLLFHGDGIGRCINLGKWRLEGVQDYFRGGLVLKLSDSVSRKWIVVRPRLLGRSSRIQKQGE